MNEHFFEQLENTGLIKNGVVDKDKVARINVTKLVEIAEQSTELTSAESFEREQSAFAHCASLSLSGDSVYCRKFDCRLSRAFELAQFALLYSDRVYIKNFLMDYAPPFGAYGRSASQFKKDFAQDLEIIAELQPLISKGIIVPFTPPLGFCPCCLAKQFLDSDRDARFQEAYEHLKAEYLDKVSYLLRWTGKDYQITIKGPEKLIDHGALTKRIGALPHKLRKSPDIIKSARSRKDILLPKEHVLELGLNEEFADKDIQSIGLELAASQSLNTSYLTERPLHIEFLNSLNQDPTLERRNQIAQKYLTSIVPFLNDVAINDLMRLRENERESFILYRESLNKAIDEYKKTSSNFSEVDAKALYSDVIEPKLVRLDQKVKAAKRSFLKESARETAAWVGAISFGIYTGFIPSDLIAAAKLLGMTKVVADFIKSTMTRTDIKESIRNEDLYFLWKVREASKS
jgi:hypothetical protein